MRFKVEPFTDLRSWGIGIEVDWCIFPKGCGAGWEVEFWFVLGPFHLKITVEREETK